MCNGLLINILLVVLCVQSLKMVPERAEIHYYNKDFVTNLFLNVRRYARNGTYNVNAGITTLHTWGNNLTFIANAYELLHNEYRPTFVNLRFQLCDFINKEPYVGSILKSRGIPCPAPAGTYSLPNVTVNLDDFPYVMPFQRIKFDGIVYVKQTILFLNASLYVHFH